MTISNAHETADNIETIPNNHLFGIAFAKGNVPITNLQLRVTGIVKVNNEQENNSKAYISMSGQSSKIYQVGDSLLNGVKIYAISNDSVILETDGRLEKLPLPREILQFKERTENETMLIVNKKDRAYAKMAS